MSNLLKDIEAEIVRIVSTVQPIKATYTAPLFTVGRALPALLVLYSGFAQQPFTQDSFVIQFDFDCTLYMPLEGRDPTSSWDEIKQMTLDLLKAFRDDWQLGGVVLWSIIDEGRPIVDVPASPKLKPKWVGHTFKLLTKVQVQEEG